MTETAKAVIDRLQGEAGHATGGEVDRLVFSGLDVHEMLNEIEQAIDTDKLSVEKLQEQLDTAKKALTEIYLDENETIIDPVFLFHQSQRIAGRALNELGENNEI